MAAIGIVDDTRDDNHGVSFHRRHLDAVDGQHRRNANERFRDNPSRVESLGRRRGHRLMDTKKLETVVVWATLVLVVYEVYKSFVTSTASTAAQLGGGTLSNVAAGLQEDVTNLFAGGGLGSGLIADPFAASSSIPTGSTEIVPADGGDPTYVAPGSSTIVGWGY